MKCDLNPLKQNRNKTASYQLLTYPLLYRPNFMAFQTDAPRRITREFGLPPQNAENHLISSVFLFAPPGRIRRFSEHERE